MPYIKGRQEERERLERLEASIQELNKNVAHTGMYKAPPLSGLTVALNNSE